MVRQAEVYLRCLIVMFVDISEFCGWYGGLYVLKTPLHQYRLILATRLDFHTSRANDASPKHMTSANTIKSLGSRSIRV